MKKMALILTVLLALPVCSFASVLSSPDWYGQDGYTYAKWDFTTDRMPLAADAGHANPYGDPMGTSLTMSSAMTGYIWNPQAEYGLPTDRRGVWGGMNTDVVFTAQIPSEAGKAKTEIWVEAVYYALPGTAVSVTFGDDASIASEVAAIASQTEIEELAEPQSMGKWYKFKGLFTLDSQNEDNFVRLTVDGTVIPAFSSTMLDQVTIMSHTVPEPATMAFLALGGLGMVFRRK